MSRKIYIYAPYFVSAIAAAIFTILQQRGLVNVSAINWVISNIGQYIPMVDGLKQASNYDPFVAFAHTIFWEFIPLMVWCGWQAVKTASSKDNMIFLHKSKFMKIGSYCFFWGLACMHFLAQCRFPIDGTRAYI